MCCNVFSIFILLSLLSSTHSTNKGCFCKNLLLVKGLIISSALELHKCSLQLESCLFDFRAPDKKYKKWTPSSDKRTSSRFLVAWIVWLLQKLISCNNFFARSQNRKVSLFNNRGKRVSNKKGRLFYIFH